MFTDPRLLRKVALAWVATTAIAYAFDLMRGTGGALVDASGRPLGDDFVNYWSGAYLAWHGRAAAAPPPKPPTSDTRNLAMRALVVDDSAMTRMVVKKTLNSLGVEDVAEAGDGAAALEIVRGGGVGVIFSDWNMPVMTGLDLLKAVRQSDKAVPFIMITTEGSREKIVDAITHGVSDYLVKPFTPVQVREKVAKWSAAVGATA